MAHLQDDDEEEPNRFTEAMVQGMRKGEAAEIRKSAAELRRSIIGLDARLTKNEEAVLAAVRRIAKRLDALEAGGAPEARNPLESEPGWCAAAAAVELNQARGRR